MYLWLLSDDFAWLKMFYGILYSLPKDIKCIYIYCINLFMSLFITPSQSIIVQFLPNLWQRRLENPNLPDFPAKFA